MSANFSLIFGCAFLLNVIVTLRSSDYWQSFVRSSRSPQGDPESNHRHTDILKRYLIVYLLATFSDWLQGPYVYALYSDYGYTQHEIAVLFVAGFGSSMIFGSFVGGMSDWGGRRAFVVLFSIVYAASCLTKHFHNFSILMLGRLLGGVATSLLFSVFEAWLIRVHADQNLKHMLSKSFSWAAYSNSVIAILAGLVAEKAADLSSMKPVSEGSTIHVGGYLSPFDLALAALIACGVCASCLWEENYGESPDGGQQTSNRKWYDGLSSAFFTTIRSRDIFLCGLISSFFEGSMYIFVFMWTPALKKSAGGDDLPFGLIFSTFMVCCMCGSSLFSILIEKIKGESLAVGVFGVASVSMMLVCLTYQTNQTLAFLGMNLFEVCVGMYFPIMGTMKGSIVPEDKRAAIYNLYRIPLNFIVLFSLLTDLIPKQSFMLNAAMLGVATVLQNVLRSRRRDNNGKPEAESESLMAAQDKEDVV